MSDKKVTLEMAVEIARRVEVIANKHGHYTALAGSCLWRGYSENDVDLVIYPHRGKESTTEETYTAIAQELGAKSFFQVRHEIPSHFVIQLDLDPITLDLFFIHENPLKFKNQAELLLLATKYRT